MISSLHRKSPQEAQQHQREKDLEGYQQLGVEGGVELPFYPLNVLHPLLRIIH